MKPIPIRVETYSGYQADQEPTWVWCDGERHEVVGVGDRWYTPAGAFFRVRTRSGLFLLLQHDFEIDQWFLLERKLTDG